MKTSMRWIFLLSVMIAAACATEAEDTQGAGRLEAMQARKAAKFHHIDGYYLTSQPSAEEFRGARDSMGVKAVLNLRFPEESPGEEQIVRDLGLRYENVPFRSPETLSDRVFEDARKILRTHDESPILMHCKSGNRVGAIWFAFRVLDMGIAPNDALEEAKVVGLKKPGHILRSIRYVEGELKKRK